MKKIYPPYVPKHYSNREKQVSLLMIPNGEGWHYLAVKILLESNQYQKSDKTPFVIYADFECLIEKIDRCYNNPENSFTTKVGEYIQSSFSMSTISSFKSIENKHDVWRGKLFMKKFCESLREYAMKLINFEKNSRSHMKMQKHLYFKENFKNKHLKYKKNHEVRDHCHYAGNIEVLRI